MADVMGQPIFGLHMQNLDEILVNLPAGFRARIGLNETSLTRALARGEFSEAERIIEEATDPEFLNDGALAATPLNMVLTGRSSYFHQSRNLKLAHLLLQKGANPNLRIPNHDLESASESPLELLLRYYLKLIEVFGLPGSGKCRTSYRPSSFEETELMDTVGLHGEIGGLGPGQITSQAKNLLLYCLDNGGDCNLPSTDATKTIFHMTLVAPVLDTDLVHRMLEHGANVNIADVHNTSPIMDIISLGDESRALSSLSMLMTSSQNLMLDMDNCSMQSALWRSIFQGFTNLSLKLISVGVKQFSSARVERSMKPSPNVYMSRSESIKTHVPALLSPLLSDSPCTANLHVRLPKRRTGQPANMEFSFLASSHVCRNVVAPLVDRGHVSDDPVVELVSGLIRHQTQHSCAGDSQVVDTGSVIPLMFGHMSAGLRQLAVRTILSHILFNCSPEEANRRLDLACEKQGFRLNQILINPSQTSFKEPNETVMSYEYEIELGSEMELSINVDDPAEENIDVVELAMSDIAVSDNPPSDHEQTSDDNESEDYAEQTISELMDTIATIDRELEVIKTDCELDVLDRDLANWESELLSTLERIQRYHAELSHLERDAQLRTVETARRRSEELIQELREQRLVLDRTEREIEDTESAIANISLDGDEVNLSNCSQSTTTDTSPTRRRWIDENWSLGSNRDFEEFDDIEVRDLGDRNVVDVVSNICQRCLDVYKGQEHSCPFQPSVVQPVVIVPQEQGQVKITHTDMLVRTLTVAANYSNDDSEDRRVGNEGDLRQDGLHRDTDPGTDSSVESNENVVLQPQSRASLPSNTESRNSIPELARSSSGSETEADSDNSSEDSDTWGGTFSLRHTLRQAELSEQPSISDATIIQRLTPRTLFALTDQIGIPHSLRPLFSIEAARLQLCLSLFCHKSVSCDRNCEGDESDSEDSEEDWLASETDDTDYDTNDDDQSDNDVGTFEDWLREGSDRAQDDQSSDSSVSNFSQRSWYGSVTRMTEAGVQMSPVSTPPRLTDSEDSSEDDIDYAHRSISGSSSWLADREDLIRVRQFLDSSPGPDFTHSTDSEDES